MELTKIELAAVAEIAKQQPAENVLQVLTDLQLSYVGGGSGDVIVV